MWKRAQIVGTTFVRCCDLIVTNCDPETLVNKRAAVTVPIYWCSNTFKLPGRGLSKLTSAKSYRAVVVSVFNDRKLIYYGFFSPLLSVSKIVFQGSGCSCNGRRLRLISKSEFKRLAART